MSNLSILQAPKTCVKQLGKDMKINEGERTKKVEIRTRMKFLTMGRAHVAMILFQPSPDFKGRPFVCSGFSGEGPQFLCLQYPTVAENNQDYIQYNSYSKIPLWERTTRTTLTTVKPHCGREQPGLHSVQWLQ